jgi:hypothetical protein
LYRANDETRNDSSRQIRLASRRFDSVRVVLQIHSNQNTLPRVKMPINLKRILLVSLFAFVSSASAFTPDVVRGCTVIAQAQKNPTTADALHAAYCLGVIDGIFASVSKQQTGVPLPDPCFAKVSMQPSELAMQIVRVLKEQPRISELATSVASDRGAMAAYLALAMSNRCKSTDTSK